MIAVDLSSEDTALLWHDVIEMTHDRPDAAAFLPWLERLTPVSVQDNIMTVSTRQQWTAKKIVEEYLPTIEATLTDITLEPIKLHVLVAPATDAVSDAEPVKDGRETAEHAAPAEYSPVISAAAQAGAAVAAGHGALFPQGEIPIGIPQSEAVSAAPEQTDEQEVVPILEDGTISEQATLRYSDFRFDTFVVGESNRIAYQMALTVAEEPTARINPLFIWGPSGNGKTHLLLSIYNFICAHQPQLKVQYVPATMFVEQYIDDIRNKKLQGSEVLKRYRDADVLLVDDVQAFEAKEESIKTFFDIFNNLTLQDKQVVLAADTAPDYLNFNDRITTRFNGGMVIDIKAPTYEMKRSILESYYERCRSRMSWCDVEIPAKSFDVLSQLAPNNPRSMLGLMTSILLKANDDPDIVTPEGIKQAVKNQFKSTEAVTIDSIIQAVSEAYGVSREDIIGSSRVKNISEARQVVIWIARQLTDESFGNIGLALNGRDHSTLSYCFKVIEQKVNQDRGYAVKLERLMNEITG